MSDSDNLTPRAQEPANKPANKKRRHGLAAVVALVIVAGGGWGLYEWLVASHYEDTDNAYVQGDVIQITPQVGGTVLAVMAEDTDFVRAGQLLVRLDPADAKVALQQAEAGLAQAVRQARTLYANNGALAAQVRLRQADLVKAQSEVARARDDLARRRTLSGNGAVSKEELNHAQAQLDSVRGAQSAAQAGIVAAREQLAGNQALTEGTDVTRHPSVLVAAARLREAWLAMKRMELTAPVDGYVAKRTVQLGQRVAAGAPLMSVVPLGQAWVDANFKEPQLQNIRLGQPVKLHSDMYGDKVEYDGKVVGLGVGTGSAFALLPAQNATGNWIKVVQRVPVRIQLDAAQLKANPLRVGLSMLARIDITDQSGPRLATTARAQAGSKTQIASQLDAGADARVREIVAANLGAAPAKPRVEAPQG